MSVGVQIVSCTWSSDHVPADGLRICNPVAAQRLVRNTILLREGVIKSVRWLGMTNAGILRVSAVHCYAQ